MRPAKIVHLFLHPFHLLMKPFYQAPKYNWNHEPKVAFCLYGVVGNIKSKSGYSKSGAKKILEIGYKHYKKHLFDKNPNVDVFIHTWSTELKKEIISSYKPKKAIFERQILFQIPDYVRGEYKHKQNHYSRWCSTKKVIELKQEYEKEKRFKYDLVFITRFDLALQEDIIFKKINPKFFYAANWYGIDPFLKKFSFHAFKGHPYFPMKGLADTWFISNSKNMDRFSSLYDCLDRYNVPGNCSPSNVGVSNHNLAIYHLQEMGVIKSLRFLFNHNGPNETAPLVRRKYFNRIE